MVPKLEYKNNNNESNNFKNASFYLYFAISLGSLALNS